MTTITTPGVSATEKFDYILSANLIRDYIFETFKASFTPIEVEEDERLCDLEEEVNDIFHYISKERKDLIDSIIESELDEETSLDVDTVMFVYDQDHLTMRQILKLLY